MSFSEFPKAMTHPQARPAVISRDTVDPVTKKTIKAAPGQPAKFQPVYVNNADQEAQYASLGYVPNGTSDPEAYRRAIAGAEAPSGHQHHEFPKWVYQAHDDGDMEVNLDGDTIFVKGVLVQSEEGLNRLKGEWHATPGKAAEAALEFEEPSASPVELAKTVEKKGAAAPRKDA